MRLHEKVERLEKKLDRIESELEEAEERIDSKLNEIEELTEEMEITPDDLEDAAEQGAREVADLSEQRLKKMEEDIQEMRFELGKDHYNRPKYAKYAPDQEV